MSDPFKGFFSSRGSWQLRVYLYSSLMWCIPMTWIPNKGFKICKMQAAMKAVITCSRWNEPFIQTAHVPVSCLNISTSSSFVLTCAKNPQRETDMKYDEVTDEVRSDLSRLCWSLPHTHTHIGTPTVDPCARSAMGVHYESVAVFKQALYYLNTFGATIDWNASSVEEETRREAETRFFFWQTSPASSYVSTR